MKTKQLTITAFFTTLTIVFAQLILPLPFTPVPLSLSLLPVFLSGAILPKRFAVLSQLAYLLLGIAGLPVFAGWKGGPGVVFGPTGGFLIAYPIMAFATAAIMERSKKKNTAACVSAMLAALLICYLFGSVFFAVSGNIGWVESLSATIFPFVLFDCLKLDACAILAPTINKALIQSKLFPFV